MPSNSWRVACFDLDGTLVYGTSTCQHLREQMGVGHVTQDFDARYAAGLMSNADIAAVEAPYYIGRSAADVDRMLGGLPLIGGIDETLQCLRRQGIHLLLTTITWTFASSIIAERFGFDAYSGYVMECLPDGTLSGRVEMHFDEESKRDFVERYCAERQIPMQSVFAVGDSRSDIPLFGAVGHSVAINATPHAIAAASCSLRTSHLPDILPLVPGLVD